MSGKNKFGSTWTIEKLNIFISYLEAYLIALKNQPFDLVYIDAFAGSGEIETSNGKHVPGSAIQALSASEKFAHYYFIEKDQNKANELRKRIEEQFPEMYSRVTIYCGDANEKLKTLVKTFNFKKIRGLLFLDPFATEVDWETLSAVSKTKIIDVWYLFPFGALNRLLPRDHINERNESCIDRLLGDPEWRNVFYEPDPQMSLFDLIEQSEDPNKDKRNNSFRK